MTLWILRCLVTIVWLTTEADDQSSIHCIVVSDSEFDQLMCDNLVTIKIFELTV